ncbi:hypothetical protein GCM10010121_088260 [Streptomyces brasiliensis]|uniref:Uncharacterized protein n=1 Tax=Streptomyces brasiliensis TaxID=1954 RepID=A0A917P6D9_9ACTN|nr:hypothetical protein GCM10010121_088260 [Streptomyces brasiliensis]
MAAGSQSHAPGAKDLPGAYAEDLSLRQRLPESLEELHGPAQGVVDLPLPVASPG